MSENLNQEVINEEPTAPAPQKSTLVTAGMILGIIGAATSFIPIVNNASFVLGILAVVFGAIGLVKRLNKGKAIAALALGVAAIVITLVAQNQASKELDYLTGDGSDDILKNYLTVEIGTFTVVDNGYWTDTALPITVKNKSDEKKSFSITIEAVDANGNRIDSETIYANNLAGGQSQSFTVFEFVLEEEIEAFLTAEFRVLEVSMY